MGITTDFKAVVFLLTLYFLQGIPLGLSASIPLLLQKYGVSYTQQAVFTISYYPFSFKFLWSGLVDSVYFKRIGRRKTWLFPVQMCIGLFLIFVSLGVESFLENKRVLPLAVYFSILNFLVATQDIVVDGWALTLLSRKNAGAAANCNAAGQTLGAFFGYGFFMALYSPDFCNKWFRSTPEDVGLVSVHGTFAFWGGVFIVVTILIAIFKTEKKLDLSESPPKIVETYQTMGRIMLLKPVKILVLIWFTCNIGTAASGEIAMLKLTERGVSRANMALLSSYLAPIRIFLPLFIERFTSKKALTCWFISSIYGLVSSSATPILVYYMPQMVIGGYEMAVITTLGVFDSIAGTVRFVSSMAFHATVSDPLLGGVYMTLLNSACNFGGGWPETLALWAVDRIGPTHVNGTMNSSLIASHPELLEPYMMWDPLYTLSIISTFLGIIWFIVFTPVLFRLQHRPRTDWAVPKTPSVQYSVLVNSIDDVTA